MHAAGLTDCTVLAADEPALQEQLSGTREPVLLVFSGAWLLRPESLKKIAPSASGRPLLAFGAIRPPPDSAFFDPTFAQQWERCLKSCGGDLDRRPWFRRSLPFPAIAYLEPAVATELARVLGRTESIEAALDACSRDPSIRTVHLAALDCAYDSGVRAIQLITTIQIGGAERVALDLAAELRRQGIATAVAVFGASRREHFPTPPDFVEFSHISSDANARADAVSAFARRFGADVINAHLIRASEMAAIRERGFPVVATLHNMPPGWPKGVGPGAEEISDLCVTCCRAVADAARSSGITTPIRTVWNGIDPSRYKLASLPAAAGAELRRRFGIPPTAFVIAVIANPRRQKRLDRLPAVLAATQRKLSSRSVRMLVIGAGPSSDDAADALAALEHEIEAHGVQSSLHLTGSMHDVRPSLSTADVLLSTSDYEGLSIAMLEAIASGVPVVATDVGGNRELAQDYDEARLVDPEASPDRFASLLAEIATSPPPRVNRLPASFTRYQMTRRYLDLYAAAIDRARYGEPSRRGVWLITNNFSTGGAQSSARRLLVAMNAAGICVRAAVVQEHPERPTPGRTALINDGVKVIAISPPAQGETEQAVSDLLEELQHDPPEVVVFWNLITSYKVLVADRLPWCRIIDVSPGEMYFDSLEQYMSAPRNGLPYRSGPEYGSLLSAAVVKYDTERTRAEQALGCPVFVIPNGIPVCDRQQRRTFDRLVIGTAARLSPQKRLEDLLDAVRLAHPRMPRYVLRIAGRPERGTETYARSLRKLAKGLPVEWCGEPTSIEQFLSDLDIFAMISEPSGCPNASLEAMAHGIPVLATAVGGACEQVVDCVTGRLVAPRNPAAFADALVDLAQSEEERSRYGAAGLARVRDRFTVDRMLADFLRVFGLQSTPAASSASAALETIEAGSCSFAGQTKP